MRNFRRGINCLLCLSFSCSLSNIALVAQLPPANLATLAHAPDPDNGVGNYAEGLFIPMVAGQPFQARIEAQVTRQLPDGTKMALKYYALEARDADGRAYREVRDMIAADSPMEPALIRTYVYDSKATTYSICTPARQTCTQAALLQPPEEETLGPSKDGKSVLTRESLGTKIMDGVEAIGTRETRTFNAGAFGNDKPVIVTKEIWYSPRLQFNLSVTRTDPRSGSQKLEVTDLKLGDPGKQWFAIPAGYRIVTERVVAPRPMAPELEPLIEKQVSGLSPDELRTALAPVEAAIGAYARAHADAAPKDNNDNFTGLLRMRLSSSLQVMQQNNVPQGQFAQTDQRLNAAYQQVVMSACLSKTAPGDPPFMPKDEASLRAEQQAWIGMRDAWVAFLKKLYPNADSQGFTWMLANEREADLRRMEAVEKNRGCTTLDSIAPMLAGVVTGMSAEQLATAARPLDTAIAAYAKAHADSAPHDRNDSLLRMTQQNLISDLQRYQQGNRPSLDAFEEADLHLNQAYRAVIGSPCLNKPIPADPPNAPASEDTLRAEERAWTSVRDAWTAFMTNLYPNESHTGYGTTLTEFRAGELRQMQAVMKNRGCKPDDGQ